MGKQIFICTVCGRQFDDLNERCECGLLWAKNKISAQKHKIVAKGVSLYVTFDPASPDGDRACASIFAQKGYNFNFVKNLYGGKAELLYSLLDLEEE